MKKITRPVPIILLLALLLPGGGIAVRGEVLLLKTGEKLEGDIIISYNRGILFREKIGSPGRYYAFDEVSRVSTADGLLYYLMPHTLGKKKENKLALFPFARRLLIGERHIAPTPYVTPPDGEPVRARCRGVKDSVTLELEKGAVVRLLGLSPPPLKEGEDTRARATDYLSMMVKGKDVLLYPGPQDPEGGAAAAAYVVAGTTFVNADLLEKGWARLSPRPEKHPYAETFRSLEKYAETLRRGSWRHAKVR